MDTGMKRLSILNLIAIFAAYTGLGEFTVMTPALHTLSQHFADTPQTTILFANTITGLASVPVAVIAGALISKVGFRPMAIGGLGLMIVSGAFPFFLPDISAYWPVIFSRILVGVGLGMTCPVGAALIIIFYEGKERSRYLGCGNMVMFAFCIILGLTSGYLCTIGWNWSFLTYLLSVIPLVMVILWLPEGKPYMAQEDEERGFSNKEKLPKAVWGYALFALVFWGAMVIANFLTSGITVERGMGDASMAGWLTTMWNIGSAVAGSVAGFFIARLRRFTLPVFALIAAVGLFLTLTSDMPGPYGAGMFLIGAGASTMFTASQNAVGNITPPSRSGFANALMNAVMQLGSFLATYYLAAVQMGWPQLGEDGPLLVSAIIYLVICVGTLVIPLKGFSPTQHPSSD